MIPGLEILLKTLSPMKMFSLLTMNLSDKLKHEVKKYDIIMDAIEKTVDFNIYDSRYDLGVKKFPYTGGEKFVGVALHYVKDKLPKDAVIHKALVKVTEENITGYLFFEKDGKKESVEYKF